MGVITKRCSKVFSTFFLQHQYLEIMFIPILLKLSTIAILLFHVFYKKKLILSDNLFFQICLYSSFFSVFILKISYANLIMNIPCEFPIYQGISFN